MPKLEELARRYIAATRGSGALDRPHPQLRAAYGLQWMKLLRLVEQLCNHSVSSDLYIVYSPEARAETVTTRDGAFVVYDQYLGQVFSQLTRLVRNDGPHEKTKNYLRKLYALRLSVAGRQLEGFLQAVAYKSTFVAFQSGPSDSRRVIEVGVQECFVLGHELTHQIFKSNPTAAELIRGSCLELASAGAEVGDGEHAGIDVEMAARAFADRMQFDVDVQYIRDGGDADKIDHSTELVQDLWKRNYEMHKSKPRQTYTELLQEVAKDERIFEEFCCDSFSVLLILMQQKEFGLARQDLLAAAFLGLHNVRLLRYIDTLAVNGPGSPMAVMQTFQKETQSRVSLFRIYTEAASQMLFSTSPQNLEEIDNLRDLYRQTNETYAAVVNDHVLWNTDKDLWNLPGKEEVGDIGEFELRTTILKLCDLA